MDTEELLTRGVANIIPARSHLEKLLNSGKKLNVYLGIDPTATQIHLGHAASLRKLQAFAELGHSATLVIGDFTALIGDTSDKEAERPALSKEEVQENLKTYKEQAGKIVDFSKVKIRFNSEWLDKLSLQDLLKLSQAFSFGDFASRELIRNRLQSGKRVGLAEALYPVMQGYDSYFLDTDIQIGGTDQTFNMQAGRTLQEELRGKESFVLATEFLMGTDGRKMSKTWNNAIWLTDKPNDMYAKVMAIKDDLVVQYYTLATSVPMNKIEEVQKQITSSTNPMAVKKQLAYEIVRELYSEEEARAAQEHFERTVQKKELPKNIPVVSFSHSFVSTATIVQGTVAAGLATSNSEAKRIIEQGGLKIGNEVITDPNAPLAKYLKEEETIQRGPRQIKRIKTAP